MTRVKIVRAKPQDIEDEININIRKIYEEHGDVRVSIINIELCTSYNNHKDDGYQVLDTAMIVYEYIDDEYLF